MKHFALLLLSLLLIAGVTPGLADDPDRALDVALTNQKIDAPNSIDALAGGWIPVPLDPLSITYGGAQYLAPSTVLFSGYSSTADYLWRSYDNGGSWTRLAPPSNNKGIVFAARDSNLVLVGTFGGTMLRTTNAGVKWDTVYQHTDYIDGVVFVGPDTAIAVGDMDASGPLLIRSTNAGATWTRQPLPSAADSAMAYAYATYRQAIAVYNRTVWITLYKSGSAPRIIKSTDAGATWTSTAVNLIGGTANNYYMRSINFINDSIGFVVGRQVTSSSSTANYVQRSSDGGATWSDTLSLQPGAHTDALARSVKGIPGTNKVLVAGAGTTSGKIWLSEDLGLTFSPVTLASVGSALTNLAILDSAHMFAIGANTVQKYTGKNVRKITFNLNTATVPDTLPVAAQTVQIRGGVNHAGGFSPITWGNDTQNNMSAVGGDYWKKDMYMQVGDTLSYKYTIAYSTGTGWEQGVVPGDFPTQTNANRSFIVPDKDTVLAVEFWNNGANNLPQYFRPWAAAPDSFFNVYFRVSMLGPISSGTFQYAADKDTVGVRGGGNAGSDLDWNKTAFLTKEVAASNGDGYTIAPASMWSGRLKFPKSSLTAGTSLSYKFLIGDAWGRDELGGQPNRSFTVPIGLKDTTLHWVFYNNERPAQRANPDTIKITFIANMAQATASGGVDVLNDTVYVRTGYFTTAIESGRGKRMVRVSGTIMQAVDTIVTAKKKNLDYQFYVVRNGVEVRENYYNFYYNGAVASEAERRQVIIDSTATLTSGQTVRDTSTSVIQARRQPNFPNGRKLARNVNVTWKCDLRPAYYQASPAWGNDSLTDIQGTYHVYPSTADSVMIWGVWLNGPATDGWTTWGIDLQNLTTKKMFDDGTNGDAVAHDSIFTRRVQAGPDSTASGTKAYVGQTFKFGIRGGDNEGGKGGFGNNHNSNIVDTDSIYTITTDFGSINPAFYDAWDYDLHKPKKPTSVFVDGQPLTYELAQNYPNPFNPTTKIEYSIPAQSKVDLKVYNIVGQEVATLVNEIQAAGVHHVKFDALNLASGIYFYRLNAGNFVSVKKMVLLK
jgi:hypothetical protein